MEQKIIFREMLSEIKALADSRQNKLTRQEVDEFFSNGHFEEEQMKMIYDYLLSQQITITGYEPDRKNEEPVSKKEKENPVSEEAWESERETQDWQEQENAGRETDGPETDGNKHVYGRSIELYLEELKQLKGRDHREELQLFTAAAGGDAQARSSLVEAYLPMVCQLAGDFEGEEYLVEDLIQEGNIGLLMALDGLEYHDSLAAYQAELMNAVNHAMEEAIQEQRNSRDAGKGIASRVNHLNQAIQNLEEELDHKVSVDELSAYLEMSVEEITDILRMAGGEIKVEGYEDS
ncbi:MAG: sigma factor [Lachnospiraceae bacterium]|nr:sigma factor [Lachnospiraceae bacterium]MDD3796268.1 sigma factor [Lachnospiraceae bacterium]